MEKEQEFEGVFIHETAVVDRPVTIGPGTRIWHFCHVMSGARIGENCVLSQNVFVAPNVPIGNRVKLQNNVSVYEGVVLEDDVFCGPSMVFTNVRNPRSHVERKDSFEQTLVQQGATLGANATIRCGVTIGRYALIGAGAVVTRNVPDHAVVVGNPSRQVGWACDCGEVLVFSKEAQVSDACHRCAHIYHVDGESIRLQEG